MKKPIHKGGQVAAIGAIAAALFFSPSSVWAEPEALATVGGAPITQQDIEQALRLPLYELEMEKYRLVRRRLDQAIVEKLLAKAAGERGLSVPAYVSAEVQSQIASIPPEPDPAKQEARNALVRERATRAVQELVERLSREAKVSVTLRPPDAPVMAIPVEDDPFWGPDSAPVTVVEFADFECPICKENLPALRQLRDLYGDRIRFVYRNFPLASHPQARPAAEAARCAHEQGKFWAYHDALFAQAPNLKPEEYASLAERVGLDRGEFLACLDSSRPKAAVAKDLADAQRLGLGGTPTFFINGRYLSGYQSLEMLRQDIESELLKTGNGARSGR